jgi:AraC family transcriptional regulator, regulatory protein of adaptative response / methylated-DNA-[protein]-cysteine methyltransferase
MGLVMDDPRASVMDFSSPLTDSFCLPTCYSRKWAKAQHTVYFTSAREARQSGYRPCKLCRPA